jgi:hypothetical protein
MTNAQDTAYLRAIALLLASSNDLTGATPITLTSAEKAELTTILGHTVS